jgi:WD repeat-containing protein 35
MDTGAGVLRRKEGRERTFHVDDASSNADGGSAKGMGTNDAIVCLAASDKYLVVGRASGTVHRYTLPHISLSDKYVLRCRPQQLALNCDSTR